MKCEDADLLMMKYIDGEITSQEAEKLNQHLLACKKCKESFLVYEGMLWEMNDIQQVDTPEGFECAIMAKIKALPQAKSLYSTGDKVKIWVAGTFAMLLSIGAIFIVYRDAIIFNLGKNQHFGMYMQNLLPLVERVEAQTENVISTFNTAIGRVDQTLSESAGFIVMGIVVLCIVQLVLVMRRNR